MKRVVRYPKDGIMERVMFSYSPKGFMMGNTLGDVRKYADGYPYTARTFVSTGKIELLVTIYYNRLSYLLDVLRRGLWCLDGYNDPGDRNRMLCYILN